MQTSRDRVGFGPFGDISWSCCLFLQKILEVALVGLPKKKVKSLSRRICDFQCAGCQPVQDGPGYLLLRVTSEVEPYHSLFPFDSKRVADAGVPVDAPTHA